MGYLKTSMVFALLTLALIVFGCSGQQTKTFKYTAPDEIAEGPGVFSKEKGEFTVYDSKKAKASDEASAKSAPQSSETAATPATAGSEVGSTTGKGQTPEDSASFQQFKEWQRDQAEFEKFQQWKQTQQGSEEYEEFQQWKRWKEYQKWQKNQTSQPQQ